MVFKKKVADPPSLDMPTFVDKATSELLDGPDLSMNLTICDFVNSHPGQARDVLKLIKKRIGSKNCKVQLLAMSVLEMVMKNCSEYVHRTVAEKGILQDMVQLAKKKPDKTVRDKILLLLDSWQEAFGGASGKCPQFYTAYRELQRFGIDFSEHKRETIVPIATPPVTQSTAFPHSQSDNQMVEDTGWRHVDSIRQGVEVLNEMLNALDPYDKQGIKDELIVQLVEQCRIEQRSITQLVHSVTNESLLFQILSVNDDLQQVLRKYDTILSHFKSKEQKVISGKNDQEINAEEVSDLIHRSTSKFAVCDETIGFSASLESLTKFNTTRQHGIDHLYDEVVAAKCNVPSTSFHANLEHTDTPDALTSQQCNQLSSVNSYSPLQGKGYYKNENVSAATVPKLPPPPIRFSERERFFEEQKQANSKFRPFNVSEYNVEKRREELGKCSQEENVVVKSSAQSSEETQRKNLLPEAETGAKGRFFKGLVDIKTIHDNLHIPNLMKGHDVGS